MSVLLAKLTEAAPTGATASCAQTLRPYQEFGLKSLEVALKAVSTMEGQSVDRGSVSELSHFVFYRSLRCPPILM